jgi:hypothetical protein
MLRVIQAVDVISSFGKEMRVAPLPAWHVENSRADWKSKHVHHASDFVAVALESEDGFVLEQILGVEI